MVDSFSGWAKMSMSKTNCHNDERMQIMVKVSRALFGQKSFQVGSMQRSVRNYAEAIDYVKSGKLGQIRLSPNAGLTRLDEAGTSPSKFRLHRLGVDYINVAVVQLQLENSTRHRFHFNFRWFWELCRRFDDRLGSPMRLILHCMRWGFLHQSQWWLSVGNLPILTMLLRRRYAPYRRFTNLRKAQYALGAMPQELNGAQLWHYRGNCLIEIMPLWSSIVVAGKSFLRQRIKMGVRTK